MCFSSCFLQTVNDVSLLRPESAEMKSAYLCCTVYQSTILALADKQLFLMLSVDKDLLNSALQICDSGHDGFAICTQQTCFRTVFPKGKLSAVSEYFPYKKSTSEMQSVSEFVKRKM